MERIYRTSISIHWIHLGRKWLPSNMTKIFKKKKKAKGMNRFGEEHPLRQDVSFIRQTLFDCSLSGRGGGGKREISSGAEKPHLAGHCRRVPKHHFSSSRPLKRTVLLSVFRGVDI